MANAFVSWVKTQYDKLIAVLVLLGLLASVLILALRLGGMKADRADKEKEIAAIEIKYPNLAAADVSLFGRTEEAIKKPFQMTNDMDTAAFVPETRVWCVKDSCGKAIPISAKTCPVCNTPQPDDPDPPKDVDNDGMNDDWERKFGLNPKDPADAEVDSDGDGFTNLQECKGGSDPKNAKIQPGYQDFLRVTKITPVPFQLVFKGTTTSTNGVMTFQLNFAARGRTFFCKMDETIQGFKLISYEARSATNKVNNAATLKVTDVSILTLQRGKKKISLERNAIIPYDSANVNFLFVLDNKQYAASSDGSFTVVWKDLKVSYRIINVDSKSGNVKLQRVSDGKEFVVSTSPAGEGDASESN